MTDWVFRGITDTELGNFGLSGDGAAGYELDSIDPADLKVQDGEIVVLAQAYTNEDKRFILVPEDGTYKSDTFLTLLHTPMILSHVPFFVLSPHTMDKPGRNVQRKGQTSRYRILSDGQKWWASFLCWFDHLLWIFTLQQL